MPHLLADSETSPVRPTPKLLQRWLPWALGACALAALSIDLPLAHWLLDRGLPRDLAKLSELCEIFAHGWGVALVGCIVWTLDPTRRRALPRILTAAWGAGLCANVLKLLIARDRPRHFDLAGRVWDSFGPLLPLGRGGNPLQSFPSSHAAVAAGLAVALIWLYPRGRRLFVVFALLACLQRMVVGAHYLSDVLAGGLTGLLFARQCVAENSLGRLFDRFETSRSDLSVRPGEAKRAPAA